MLYILCIAIVAPPTYEECVKGQRHIKDDGDSDYTRGQLQWAPSYPTYNWPPEGSTSNAQAPIGWNVEHEENRV